MRSDSGPDLQNGGSFLRPCVIGLPPANDTGTRVSESWTLELPGGINFEGLHFQFPDGCSAGAAARWLRPGLLSVEISVRADVTVPCARCLKRTALAISDNLMYLYYSRGSAPSGLTVPSDDFPELSELPDSEGAEDFLEAAEEEECFPVEVDFFGRTLDVAPQIEESILLLLPGKPLCRGDCAGLCPRCGADLNEGPCSCGADEGDPRFEILRSVVPDSEA